MPTLKEWSEAANELLAGRTIVKARYMTDKEMKESYWDRRAVVLELDNGLKIFPSQDDEGNGPGAVFGEDKDGQGIGLPVF